MNWRIILILFVSAFLFSCETTSTISLEVLRPAEINFSGHVSKIAIVDNSVAQPSSYGHLVYSLRGREANLSFDSERFKTLFVNNLSRRIQKNVDVSVVSDKLMFSKTYNDTRTLNLLQIREIADKENADVVLTIDNNLLSSIYRVKYLESENVYRATFDATQTIVFNLFEKSEDSFLSRNYVQKDSLYWENYDFTAENVNAGFPNRGLCLEDLINYSVDKVAKKLFASKEIVSRSLYGTTNSNMQDATRYARKNEWNEASDIWEFMYEHSSNRRLKGFCAGNLALCSEIVDQFDQAIYWANIAKANFQSDTKSHDQGDDRNMDSYVKELKKRKADAKLLEKQNVN